MFEPDVNLLQCPSCKGSVAISEVRECSADGEILKGTLSSQCGARYLIEEGIPHFDQKQEYAASFGFEWEKWPRVQFDSENVGTPFEGLTAKRLFTITGVSPESMKGKVVLEIGCGAGRFLEVLQQHGAKVVGLERSDAVYVARANLQDRRVLIVKGDALNPPFRDRVFDLAFAIGVLHHTPAPEQAFSLMVRKVRPGGVVAAHVYSKYDQIYQRITNFWRRLFRVFGRRALVAYCYFSAGFLYYLREIPVLGHGIRLLLPTARHTSFSQRCLDLFDRLSPTYASHHDTREVFDWFKRAGCIEIEPTAEGPTSFTGIVA